MVAWKLRFGRLALLLPFLCLLSQTGHGWLITGQWYFGADKSGICVDSTRWTDSDGATLLPTGAGVQLLWVGPDGIKDPPDPATCGPSGDDEFITGNGGTALTTFGTYHDAFTFDGVGDGLSFFCNPKEGRWRGDDTINEDDHNFGDLVYIRAFNGDTCASSTHYGDSHTKALAFEESVGPGGNVRWTFGPGSYSTNIPMPPQQTPTSTPTPTITPPPAPAPTPLFLDIHRDKILHDASPDVTITWQAHIGLTYDIYSAPAMTSSPAWSYISSVTADSDQESYTDTLVFGERYYAVEVQGSGVYSPNNVGTLPLTILAKSPEEIWQLSILGISLNPTPDTEIQDVIGWQMEGSPDGLSSDEIWLYDTVLKTYMKNWIYDSGASSPYDGTWFDAEEAIPSTDNMPVGTGIWCMNRSEFDQTIYLDGFVQGTILDLPIHVATDTRCVHYLGQSMAADVPLTNVTTDLWRADGSRGRGSPDGLASDEIWLWDQGNDIYQKNWLYDSLVSSPYDGTWFDAEQAIPTSDVLGKGQGWRYKSNADPSRAGAPSWLWQQPLPY